MTRHQQQFRASTTAHTSPPTENEKFYLHRFEEHMQTCPDCRKTANVHNCMGGEDAAAKVLKHFYYSNGMVKRKLSGNNEHFAVIWQPDSFPCAVKLMTNYHLRNPPSDPRVKLKPSSSKKGARENSSERATCIVMGDKSGRTECFSG